MIILDTNVIAELQKPSGDPGVLKKLATYDKESIFLTAITVHEIWYGCMRLAEGARKKSFCLATQTLFNRSFANRILPLEENSALICGQISAISWRQGKNYSLADLQIAAIALHHDFKVMTRDVDDFQHDGLKLINPWTD